MLSLPVLMAKAVIQLGTLGRNYSAAHAINNAGQVVGTSKRAGAMHAFFTGPNGVGMTDLNSLVDTPHGFFLIPAPGINSVGQVIATAQAIPEPDIQAMLLAGLALIGFRASQKNGSTCAVSEPWGGLVAWLLGSTIPVR